MIVTYEVIDGQRKNIRKTNAKELKEILGIYNSVIDSRNKGSDMKPTWKEIFNTDISKKTWGYIGNAHEHATEAGYPYFSWNGWIYDAECNKTEWTVGMID